MLISPLLWWKCSSQPDVSQCCQQITETPKGGSEGGGNVCVRVVQALTLVGCCVLCFLLRQHISTFTPGEKPIMLNHNISWGGSDTCKQKSSVCESLCLRNMIRTCKILVGLYVLVCKSDEMIRIEWWTGVFQSFILTENLKMPLLTDCTIQYSIILYYILYYTYTHYTHTIFHKIR